MTNYRLSKNPKLLEREEFNYLINILTMLTHQDEYINKTHTHIFHFQCFKATFSNVTFAS